MRRREFIAALGSAAAWPVVARAQQAMPVIGFMSARSPEDTVEVLKAFHNGLEQGGFIDGRNVNIEYRWARGDYSRLPVLATELIGRHIDVLVATGGDRAARAAKEATATIPVVFNMSSDPVKAGLVESFDQPGGNVTGSVLLADTLEPKRLDLLHEIVPDVALFGALVNPTYPAAADQLRDLEAAVPKFGRRLLVATASNDDELTKAFAMMERAGVGAKVRFCRQSQPDLRADDHIRWFELLQSASEVLFRFAVAVLDCGVEVVHAGGDRPCDGALLVAWIAAHHQPADRAAAEAQHRELQSSAPKYSHFHCGSSAL